jgi:hypothetical protein
MWTAELDSAFSKAGGAGKNLEKSTRIAPLLFAFFFADTPENGS